ncbi:hypothetical protein FRC20_002645 [Serendipita sp. 405]|nr:hypothetical protein FRC15_008916 [Serendipita sp. 397]KAG8868872.1 hypothetical protein FRC20_002645 [Serendipita sp. 405]
MVYAAPLLVSSSSEENTRLENKRLQLLKSIQDLSGNSSQPTHLTEITALRNEHNQIVLDQLDSRRGPWSDPLAIFPVEIWIHLISQIIECRWGTSYRMISHVLLVSRKWRAAIVSVPQFWTQISVEPGFGEEDILLKIVTALYLSRDLPLTIYIDHPIRRDSYEACRALLAPHSNRIRDIIFRSPFKSLEGDDSWNPSIYQILSDLLPLPNLQEIHLHSSFSMTLDEWKIVETLPSIKALEGDAIPSHLLRHMSLVNLNTLTMYGSVNKLFRIIENLPRLKTLTMMQLPNYVPGWTVEDDTDAVYEQRDVPLPEHPLSLQSLTWLKQDGARLEDLLQCSPNLTHLTFQGSWKLLGQIIGVLFKLPLLSYLSVDLQWTETGAKFFPAKVIQNTNIRQLILSSEWFNARNEDEDHSVESLKLSLLIDLWRPTLEAVENLSILLYKGWTVPLSFLSSTVNLRALTLYLPGFDELSALPNIVLNALEDLYMTLPSKCFNSFLSSLQCPNLLALSLRTPSFNRIPMKEIIQIHSQQFPKLSALHWCSSDLVWDVESHNSLKLVAFLESATQAASDFCAHLILRPQDFPLLEQLEFYIFPEWDLLFLMLERRNFLLDQSVLKITTVILPTTLGLILRGSLTSLLRGQFANRLSNHDLSIVGIGEIYFDHSLYVMLFPLCPAMAHISSPVPDATGAVSVCKHARLPPRLYTTATRRLLTKCGRIIGRKQ